MRTVRLGISGITIALLTLGYLGSQYAAMTGTSREWAQRMDQPPVVLVSLVLFVGAVILFLLPDREGDETNP